MKKSFFWRAQKSGEREYGFTLVELLVVIMIIGVLSSVIFLTFSNSRAKARDAKRLSDLQAIGLAMRLYYESDNGRFPDWPNRFNDLCSDGSVQPPSPFMSVLPSDPGGKKYYCSDAGDAAHQTFCVWVEKESSSGPDYIISNKNGAKETDKKPTNGHPEYCNQ